MNNDGSLVALTLCFFCVKGNEILLATRYCRNYKNETVPVHDMSQYHHKVVSQRPCPKCEGHMKQGIIVIAVRDPAESYRKHTCGKCYHTWDRPVTLSATTQNLSGEATLFCPKCASRNVASGVVMHDAPQNPYRTGGWWVVREEAITRLLPPGALQDDVLRRRVAFMTDGVCAAFGLTVAVEV